MSDKQKIAFLCHPYHRGGVTRWMADAAIAFAKKGFEVYFVTVAPEKEFHSAKGRETLLQLLNKEPNTVKTITASVGYEFEFGTPEYRSHIYRQLLVQLPPGTPVILSDDYSVWESATSISASYPVVGVLHADEDHYYRLAEMYGSKVSVFTCVSGRVHRTLLNRVSSFDPRRTFIVPCGINLPATGFDLPHGNILQLAYVGRVSTYQKRAGDLAKICSALAGKGVEFHLSVIGDGNAKAPLEAAISAAGLQRSVTFYGWLSQAEVAHHLSRSDMLLLTSDFEGTPIAMMEALAAGCGMVGTRVSGIEDYELHPLAPECLAVYEVGKIDEAVEQINKLASVPRGSRQQAARQLAESEFSMDVCLERYLKAMAAIPNTATPATPQISMPATSIAYSKALALARFLKVRVLK